MERATIHGSTNVASAAYDERAQVLEIGFHRRGGGETVYQYEGVPLCVWQGFQQAPTKGGFLQANIKGRYPVVKIQ